MAKKKSPQIKRIITPGLKRILKEEVPLAAKVLQGNKYNHILVRGNPRIGKSQIRDEILNASGLVYKDTVNCAAMPSELLESALFGHKKGSFTGADSDQTGLLDDKNDRPKSQVVFLEEIGELSKKIQAKLLVFLDTGLVQPIGVKWGKGRTSTVRTIATTNVEDKDLREDIRGRLWEVKVPPLHKRRLDIPIFINHFLKDSKIKLSPQSLVGLTSYNWSGGVSEIEKMCMRLKAGQKLEDIAPNIGWYHNSFYDVYINAPHFKIAREIDKLFPTIVSNKLFFELDDFQKELNDFWVFYGQDLTDPNNLLSNVRQHKKTIKYMPTNKDAFLSKTFQHKENVINFMFYAQSCLYGDKSFDENALTGWQHSINADVTKDELLKNYWASLLDVRGLSNKEAAKIAGVNEGTISKKRDKYKFPKRKK